jgi:hypothetical protein
VLGDGLEVVGSGDELEVVGSGDELEGVGSGDGLEVVDVVGSAVGSDGVLDVVEGVGSGDGLEVVDVVGSAVGSDGALDVVEGVGSANVPEVAGSDDEPDVVPSNNCVKGWAMTVAGCDTTPPGWDMPVPTGATRTTPDVSVE